MVYSISVDGQGRINGVCPDDLTGGTGWVRAETDLTPQTELFDARGVALYKMVDDVTAARTAKEMDADAPEPVPTDISEAERLDQIEAALIEIAALAATAAGGE